jgi:hypothetical protein
METYVEFRSDRFPAYESENDQVNPGRFGKRLAEFLAAGLPSHGFETQAIRAEDWGWIVPIKNDRFPLWIGCGNYEEYPDGFLCFIEPHTPVIRRLFRKLDTRQRVEELRRAMDAMLTESAGMREKRWWTADEFNLPRG